MNTDAASMILQGATALTAALSLMFSRLEAHRKRTSEPVNYRDALFTLLHALRAWWIDATMTDQAFQEWTYGQLDDSTAIGKLNSIPDRVAKQRLTSEQVLALLRSDSGEAQNLRTFLDVYQPELLTLLDEALSGRRRLIDQLVDQMQALRAEGVEAMRAASNKLHRASEEINQAAERVRLYIRDDFPLQERGPAGL